MFNLIIAGCGFGFAELALPGCDQGLKKSGTEERIPDVIEEIRNEKQGIIFV